MIPRLQTCIALLVHYARWQYSVNKRVLSQLMFEKRSWILKCNWKMVAVIAVLRRWVMNLELVVEILNICDFKSKVL
jgi:hypothetical protein